MTAIKKTDVEYGVFAAEDELMKELDGAYKALDRERARNRQLLIMFNSLAGQMDLHLQFGGEDGFTIRDHTRTGYAYQKAVTTEELNQKVSEFLTLVEHGRNFLKLSEHCSKNELLKAQWNKLTMSIRLVGDDE